MLKNKPNNVSQIVAAHRFLATLRLLAALPEHRSNEAVLCDVLNRHGLVSTWEDVRASLNRLEEWGTITTTFEEALLVMQLTRRGEDVSQGRTNIDGIASPGPECPY